MDISTVADTSYMQLAPSILVFAVFTACSYIKIATAMSILKFGFGFFGLPSAIVTGILALSLSYFTVAAEIGSLVNDSGSPDTLSEEFIGDWIEFMKSRTDEDTLQSLVDLNLSKGKQESLTKQQKTLSLLVPSFVISQLQEAFRVGLILLLPFVVIDLIVITVVGLVGVQNVPVEIISLPLKIAMFVALDGWKLVSLQILSGGGG